MTASARRPSLKLRTGGSVNVQAIVEEARINGELGGGAFGCLVIPDLSYVADGTGGYSRDAQLDVLVGVGAFARLGYVTPQTGSWLSRREREGPLYRPSRRGGDGTPNAGGQLGRHR